MSSRKDLDRTIPDFLTLEQVLAIGATSAKLADFASQRAIQVFALGARFEDRTVAGSVAAHPTGVTQLGVAEAAYVLANYPFDEVRVVSSWEELDIVLKPSNLRFKADEIRALAKSTIGLAPRPKRKRKPAPAPDLATFAPEQPHSVWPWGDHTTDLLEHLAAAADRFWKFYDPTDPSTAPTNKQVEDWLIERKVSLRVAGIMAQMLRPTDLPAGPRR